MSELAFNLSGEPFEVPPEAAGWRVRRMKGRGAPEVVYSQDGGPLVLPIDATVEDLRAAARGDGRYRVDPVDEHNRAIANAPAGYVCVASETPPEAVRAALAATSESVAIEAMRMNAESARMNTDLARTIIERFPAMMDAAAGLLRAADGAGMPAREPRIFVTSNAQPEATRRDDEEDGNEEDDDEHDDAGAEEPKSTLVTVLESLVPIVMPAVMAALAGGKFKLPGGLASLLDASSAKPRASSGAQTRSAGASGARPGSRERAPVVDASASPAERSTGAAASRSVSDVETSARRAGTAPDGGGASEPDPTPAAHGDTPETAPPASEPPGEMPTLDAAALAHFAAVQGGLTAREAMLARSLAAELSPAELRSWLADLRALSVPDAVARIRSVLGPDGAEAQTGGAS